MTMEEVKFVAATLIGVQIPPVEALPVSELPILIVHLLLGALGIKNPSIFYQPISAADIEFINEKLEQIPLLEFVERLRAQLDPARAYLLLVVLECYWILDPTKSKSESILTALFNIREGTNK